MEERQEPSRVQLAAVDAVQELQDSLAAYRALEALMAVDVPQPQRMTSVERGQFGALLRSLNARLGHDLARAEAAMQATLTRRPPLDSVTLSNQATTA